MSEIVRDVMKWLIGGGAVTLATLVGTSAYQQGQLQIEREKNLQQFLDKYVELAVNGTVDQRIRFVSYWESLDVAEKIGVNFARYHEALQNEIDTAKAGGTIAPPAYPAAIAAQEAAPSARQPPPKGGEEQQQYVPLEIVPVPGASPKEAFQAFYASRSASVQRLAAPGLERAGLEALLARNFDLALQNFKDATRAWPDYHNVDEITGLLEQRADQLKQNTDPAWRALYQDILRSYGWGMPSDLRKLMEQKAAAG